MKAAKILFVMLAALLLAAVSATPQAPAPAKEKRATAKKADGKMASAKKEDVKTDAAILDINSATEAQLKELPGIGDAYAAKIVQNRPYKGKNELLSKKVLPAKTYAQIKDRIIAKQK